MQTVTSQFYDINHFAGQTVQLNSCVEDALASTRIDVFRKCVGSSLSEPFSNGGVLEGQQEKFFEAVAYKQNKNTVFNEVFTTIGARFNQQLTPLIEEVKKRIEPLEKIVGAIEYNHFEFSECSGQSLSINCDIHSELHIKSLPPSIGMPILSVIEKKLTTTPLVVSGVDAFYFSSPFGWVDVDFTLFNSVQAETAQDFLFNYDCNNSVSTLLEDLSEIVPVRVVQEMVGHIEDWFGSDIEDIGTEESVCRLNDFFTSCLSHFELQKDAEANEDWFEGDEANADSHKAFLDAFTQVADLIDADIDYHQMDFCQQIPHFITTNIEQLKHLEDSYTYAMEVGTEELSIDLSDKEQSYVLINVIVIHAIIFLTEKYLINR